MTSEAQIFCKDRIKLNILQDILTGIVNVSFQLNNSAAQDYASQIHTDGKRVYVFGRFNISEDANDRDTITIRPIMVDTPLTITFHANADFSGKKVSVIRNDTKTVAHEFEISSETTAIELIPQEKQCYLMKVIYGGVLGDKPLTPPVEIRPTPSEKRTPQDGRVVDPFWGGSPPVEVRPDERIDPYQVGPKITAQPPSVSPPPGDDTELRQIEKEISVIEGQQEQLSRKKQSALDHLNKIETEYKKDYAAFKQELEDYKSRLEADASIIEHYKDQDIVSIEDIFQEIRLKLEKAEEQICYFIEAKQRKTMDIETEIKSNRKR